MNFRTLQNVRLVAVLVMLFGAISGQSGIWAAGTLGWVVTYIYSLGKMEEKFYADREKDEQESEDTDQE